VREFESAQRTRNATGISNARAKIVRDSEEVRAAVDEIAVELKRCRQDSFRC